MSARDAGALRVAIVGARGRMGRFTAALIDSEGMRLPGGLRLELACEVSSSDDLRQQLEATRPHVAVDFTRAGAGFDNGLVMLACGVRPLIGTSGVDAEQTEQLDTRARALGLGGLVVPNFSLGIWLQQRMALEAAPHLRSVEIIEEHHAGKRDAPSGTALDTAAQLGAAGHGATIPIHSVRLPGLLSNQTVLFAGLGEVLRITHETYSVEAFGPGILASLAYVATADGVARGLGHAIAQ